MDIITGQILPGYGAGGWSSTAASKKDRIEQWYLEPLERMSGHDAFICLAVVFLLYEKFLRLTKEIGEGEKFAAGHKVFSTIGADLGVDAATAFLIWNKWRNGLLHRGMPLQTPAVTWALKGGQAAPVTQSGTELILDPWRVRDIIVGKIRSREEIWGDVKAPLMDVFVEE